MSRRRRAKKRLISADPIYDSRLVNMLVNRVMKDGKKSLAYKIVYQTLNQIAQKTEQDPLKVLEESIRNVKPLVEVKARRVGGSVFQVPLEVNSERGTVLALQWVLVAARNRSGRSSIAKLTNELIDASKKTGAAIKKKDDIHRQAEANKAFAKFRF